MIDILIALALIPTVIVVLGLGFIAVIKLIEHFIK